MRRRRVVFAGLVLAGLTLGLALTASNISTVQRVAQVAFRAQLVHLRTGLNDEGDRVVVLPSDRLRIAGTVYRPSGPANSSAIVLVHGNSPSGRRLGLYTLLARELARRGYLVLTIDLRGFGDSDEPETVAAPDWEAQRDISAAVTYLGALPGGDVTKVHVVGHSMGGAYAVAAAATDARIASITAVSPTRRVDEQILAPGAPKRDFFYRRFVRLRGARGHPEETVPVGSFLEIARGWRLENHAGHFAARHQPILLVDGELEAPEDRSFLRRLYSDMSAPKRYVTLARSNHYLNSTDIGPVNVYDARALRALADTIGAWLSHASETAAAREGRAVLQTP
jgi:pimeloyl-ACP methyl ester carboxylesterase